MSKTNRIEREKQIVQKMIAIYCRHHLKQGPTAGGTGPENQQRKSINSYFFREIRIIRG